MTNAITTNSVRLGSYAFINQPPGGNVSASLIQHYRIEPHRHFIRQELRLLGEEVCVGSGQNVINMIGTRIAKFQCPGTFNCTSNHPSTPLLNRLRHLHRNGSFNHLPSPNDSNSIAKLSSYEPRLLQGLGWATQGRIEFWAVFMSERVRLG